jgi:2-polyprenyl-3-methyl-5-hydroxy-6-metoxy-1,4-benzoquinol methylase/ribosomal protein S27E
VKPLDPSQLIEVACDLCGSRERRTLVTKPGVVYDHVFRIVRCASCGHVYVSPRLSDDLIDGLYDDEYYAGRGFDRTVRYSDFLEGAELQGHYRNEILTLREAAGSLQGRTVLDIGCGSGSLVRALRAVGASAFGFDASPAARTLCERYNAPLAAATMDELYGSGRQYDIVTAMEVIEHTLSPLSFLRAISGLVRPGGILLIGTGNWNLVRLEPKTPYLMPEGHIHYLTPVTLGKYFRKAGLQTTGTFNFMWIGWRLVSSRFGRIGPSVARATGAFASRISPGIGPFPVAQLPLQ